MDHVSLKELARWQHRLCWTSLVTLLLLFLGVVFLPVNRLTSLAIIAAIAFCPVYCVYRLVGLLQFDVSKEALCLMGSSSPLVPLAAIVMHASPGTGPQSMQFPLFPVLLNALLVTFLISAAILVRLNLAAIRTLKENGLIVSFLGTTLSREL